jgi:hypothetical protein
VSTKGRHQGNFWKTNASQFTQPTLQIGVQFEFSEPDTDADLLTLPPLRA